MRGGPIAAGIVSGIALGLVLGAGTAPAGGRDVVPLDAVPEGTWRVAAVRVEGTTAIAARDVRAVMATRLPPWYALWRRRRERPELDPGMLRDDAERIRDLLRQRGYYEARVAVDVALAGDEATVIVRVEEGTPVHVAAVTLRTVDFTPDADETAALEALPPLATAGLFRQDAYLEGQTLLRAHFRNRGYAYAEVERAALVDTAIHEARVTYTITRGISAVFGATTITGLVAVDERLVRRELGYREGAPWDERELTRAQTRIFGLRLFRSVTVQPADPDDRSGVVGVAVTVVEGPSRAVALGVGYGIEDGVRGQVRWQAYDFLGGGRQLGVRLKGSEIEQLVEGTFRQPYFLHPAQTLVVAVTTTREDEPAYTNKRVRLTPRLERRFGPTITAAVGYNVEYDDLTDVPAATVARLDDFRARGFVSSVTGVLERNTTFDLLDPREGSVQNLTFEQAGGPWGGDFTFYRGALETKHYLPLPHGMTLAGRVRIGAGDGFGQSGDLPMFRRFYAGGINSTRGYQRWQVGPRNEFRKPVGGRSLLDGSVEIRMPVPWWAPLGAVVFVDAAEVRRAPFSYSLDALQLGVGAGLRYLTVVGPLRLDVGVPLDRPAGEPSWVVQFSIGQAF